MRCCPLGVFLLVAVVGACTAPNPNYRPDAPPSDSGGKDIDAATQDDAGGPDAMVSADLASLTLSAPLDFTFDRNTVSYTLSASVLTQAVAITPTAVDPGATITVAGETVTTGMESSPIELALGENTIDIVVTDGSLTKTYTIGIARGAQIIDQLAYAKASNTGEEDQFGRRVALWGDTLAVGAPGEDSAATGINGDQSDDSASDSGAVYIFGRTGQTWTQQAYIKASNTDQDDEFGRSVALWGDTLAVGADGEASAATGVGDLQTDNTAKYSGAVYVFHRDGDDWTQKAYIKASNTNGDDRFGTSVALWNDTLAVAAPVEDSAARGIDGNQSDNTASASGAVYVFRRTDEAWAQEGYIKASNSDDGDHFGSSVAVYGDSLAVGATEEDSAASGIGGDEVDNSAASSGAAYVFRRSNGTWMQEAYVKASNPDLLDHFGTSVALSDNTLAVGASGEESAATGVNGSPQGDNSVHASGAVYVFRRADNAWTQEAYIKASNPDISDQFGGSVAIWRDVLTVGTKDEDSSAAGIDGDQTDNSIENSGAAYVFRRLGETWAQTAYVKASNPGEGNNFGINVSLWRDEVAVGAASTQGFAEGGAVYVFR